MLDDIRQPRFTCFALKRDENVHTSAETDYGWDYARDRESIEEQEKGIPGSV